MDTQPIEHPALAAVSPPVHLQPLVAPERSIILDTGSNSFNPGLIEFKGIKYLTWRKHWSPAEIWIGLLTPEGKVRAPRKILPRPGERHGSCEDPRLFIHNDSLWIAFTWLHEGGVFQAIGHLDESLNVTTIQQFRCFQSSVEKNWQFFSAGRELYAIYKIFPHIVGKLSDQEFHLAHQSTSGFRWDFGEPRGGTPPVRIGDEFFSFFHSSTGGRYVAAPYAFSAYPPFQITRWPVRPMLVAQKDEWRTHGHLVVFPCGAVFDGQNWEVAYGWHDKHCCLINLAHEEVLGLMRPVKARVEPIKSPVIVLTLHKEHPHQVEWCLHHLRAAYPGSPLVIIVDGKSTVRLESLARRFQARLTGGEHLRKLSSGLSWWKRFFETALQEYGDYILKVDADTRCWKPMKNVPESDIFGTVLWPNTADEHVQAGCMGFSWKFARDFLSSGVCDDPGYCNQSFWSLSPQSEAWIKSRGKEYLSLDCTILHAARRLGAKWSRCHEIRSTWGTNASDITQVHAFSHPHKGQKLGISRVGHSFDIIKHATATTHTGQEGDEVNKRCWILPAANSGSLGDEAAMLGVATGFSHWQVVRRSKSDWSSYKGMTLDHLKHRESDCAIAIGADVLDGTYGNWLPDTIFKFMRNCPGNRAIVGFSFSKDANSRIVETCRKIPVEFVPRDPVSAERFSRATGRKPVLGADPAFLIEPEPASKELAVWAEEMRAQNKRIIGLNLSGLLHEREPKIRAALESWSQRNTQYAFLMLPHDSRNTVTDGMLLATLSLPRRSFMLTNITPQAVKGACELVDGVITGRMHCGIAALGQKKPALFIDYAQKVEGLCEMFGTQDCRLSLESFDGWRETLDFFSENMHHYAAKVSAALPSVEELARNNWVA